MLFKSFDLFLQLILALAIAAGYIAPNLVPLAGYSLIAFAGLQIISLIIHATVTGKGWKENQLRKIHLICTGIVVLVMLYGLFKPAEDKYDMSGLGIVIYALIPAIATALFYTVITFLEWNKMKKTT